MIYECWLEDEGRDQAVEIINYSAEWAASEAAEKIDDDSGSDAFSRDMEARTVCVSEKGSEEVKKYKITPEAGINYYADEVI